MHRFLHILFILLVIPAIAGASELRLEKSSASVRVGDTFILSLSLDTQDEIINAFEGSLNFSPNLKLKDIRLAGSIVPLWISSPKEKEGNVVEFAGVLPGGYQGSTDDVSSAQRGNAFTLVFEALGEGVARVSFGPETAVYRNDGDGTRAALQASSASFPILASLGTASKDVFPEDTIPPEPFAPLIMPGEPFGYAGTVLIFSAQDKDSGILRFDVARSYNKYAREKGLSWQGAESPYALSQKDLDKYLFVRAVDRAGNTRMEILPPQIKSVKTFLHEWWLVVLGLLLFGAILYKRLRSRI